MPQLGPLTWVLSFFMVTTFIISMALLDSFSPEKIYPMAPFQAKNINFLFLW